MKHNKKSFIALALAFILVFGITGPITILNASSVEANNVETVDVSLNTQFVSLDRKWSSIPGAITKLVNVETGEEFVFEMGNESSEPTIPHQQLPAGTYKYVFVSVPENSELLNGKKYVIREYENEIITKNSGLTFTLAEVVAEDTTEESEVIEYGKAEIIVYSDVEGNKFNAYGSTVKLVDSNGNIFEPDSTDIFRFKFEKLPFGEYTLQMTYPEGFVSRPSDKLHMGENVNMVTVNNGSKFTVDNKYAWKQVYTGISKLADLGVEVRGLDNKRIDTVTIKVENEEGILFEGSYNEYKQFLVNGLKPGTYTITLSDLPENTKAVINESAPAQIGEPTDTENVFALTLTGDEEGRKYLAVKLEELPQYGANVIVQFVDTDYNYLNLDINPRTVISDGLVGMEYDVTDWKEDTITDKDGQEWNLVRVDGEETGTTLQGDIKVSYVYEKVETPTEPEVETETEVETTVTVTETSTNKESEIKNPKTSDAGIGMYGAMTLLSSVAYIYSKKRKK